MLTPGIEPAIPLFSTGRFQTFGHANDCRDVLLLHFLGI